MWCSSIVKLNTVATTLNCQKLSPCIGINTFLLVLGHDVIQSKPNTGTNLNCKISLLCIRIYYIVLGHDVPKPNTGVTLNCEISISLYLNIWPFIGMWHSPANIQYMHDGQPWIANIGTLYWNIMNLYWEIKKAQ